MNQIIEWSQGNAGALTFLASLVSYHDSVTALQIALKLERCKSIRGTAIWVLYSDLCGKDMNRVLQLCQLCPDDTLQDACSRQDYSGRKLVQDYLLDAPNKNPKKTP